MSITRNGSACVVTIVMAGGLTACSSSGSTGNASSGSASKSSGSSSSSFSSPGSSSAGSSTSSSAVSGSEAGKSATQVLADTKSALFNAKSVHISGTVTSKGQQQKLDLRFQGSNAADTETIQGLVVNIVKIGPTAYIKAPAGFWTKTAGSKGAGLAGKWIKALSESVLGSLTLQNIAAGLNSADSPMQSGVKQTTLNGKKALVLTQKDGSTLTVADASSPVPLQIVNKAAAKKGQLAFTGYGAPQNITAPKGAMTAD